MSTVYAVLQTSKQLHQYHRRRQVYRQAVSEQIKHHIQRHRVLNHRLGLKKLYHLMPDCVVGRDQFIAIAVGLGLAVKKRKKQIRTTFSVRTIFQNLIAGQRFDNINQVWVSDITYVKIKDDDAYVVFIFDIYSKVIVGYNASLSLAASQNQQALKRAFRFRQQANLAGLIHHSDKGSQYIAGDYLMMLYERKIQVSMCDCALDNAYAERINGIIKAEYLENCVFENLAQLQQELKRAVGHYNTNRPHWALKLMTPCGFEQQLKSLTKSQRTILTVAKVHT
jgi:putative transposase